MGEPGQLGAASCLATTQRERISEILNNLVRPFWLLRDDQINVRDIRSLDKSCATRGARA